MDALQKVQIKLEERRRELNKLLDLEERGEDFQDKLGAAKKAIEDCQIEVSAAALAQPEREEHRTETPEGAELREMVDQANIGYIFQGVVGHRIVDGVERELQQHFKLAPNVVPLEMLERRAAATFTGDEPASARPVIPQLFPASAAAFAGVSIETVPSGESQYPVLTTGATAHTPAQGADAAETTAAFDITTLTPKRISAGFSYQLEDAAVMAYLDGALRQNLSDALQAELDKQILRRSDGLLGFGTNPSTPGAETTAAQYLAAIYDAVDGIYAQDAAAIRMLVGSGANGVYAHMGGTFRGNSAADNIATLIGRLSGGLRVSGHIAAYSSNHQESVVIKGPARRNCVAAVWQGVQIIPDMVTRAREGEVKLTAVMLYDFSVVREDGYKRHRFRTS